VVSQVLSRRLRLSGDFNFHSIAKLTQALWEQTWLPYLKKLQPLLSPEFSNSWMHLLLHSHPVQLNTVL